MNIIPKFTIYGFFVGILYSLLSMGLFLLCQFTGIGITYWGGTGAARMSYCPVNFLLKPFAIFYLTISRGKGLFFTASNFVLVGETLLILIAFTILGAIIGITINKKK